MSEREAIYRLAAATLLDARTVGRVLRGETVRASSFRAIEAAARRLRIRLPRQNGTPA